jgi:hypothetical protein
VTPLPIALARVSVPRFLSPSRFDDLRKCRLWVLSSDGIPGALPAAPVAVLGTLLHHAAREVAEGRWGESRGPREAFDAVLTEAVFGLQPGRVPLDVAVGRQRWFTRVARARSWAVEDAPSAGSGNPRALSGRATGTHGPTEARADIGYEAWIVWPEGRLRGRADVVESTRRGRRIVENKSGRAFDWNGDLVEGIGVQLGLYALATEAVVGGVVETVLRGDERVTIPWDAGTRERVRALLEETLAELPAGEEMPAASLASPGPHCGRCSLRPTCGAYLAAASLWTREETSGRMPLDVWGELIRSESSERGVRAELRDDAGRFVVVSGLSPDWGIQTCAPGSRLYFFDLEADEDRQHAERIQAANLVERSAHSGSNRRSAFQLRVFRG